MSAKMKRISTAVLSCILLFMGVSVLTGAARSAIDSENIDEFTEVTVDGGIRHYAPFSYQGNLIRLFPESNLTKQEAITTYPNAYAYVTELFLEYGMSIDLDDEEFQDNVKEFFLIELDDKELEQELVDFASFMDFYENARYNQAIYDVAGSIFGSQNSLNKLMPATGQGTQPSMLGTALGTSSVYISSYGGSGAATYAQTWWNKTNNTDYPYYAEYYGQSTSTNNLNDLPSGASGQSNPRRGWNDCTNFISQAIYEGGVEMIQSGWLLPHQNVDNWYYTDSKPSHTWGGAPNFYQHFSARAGVASSSGLLQVGDAISVDFTGDGSCDHTIIITYATGTYTNQQYVTYHTTDSKETRTLSYFYDTANYPNRILYGYELDLL